MIMAEMKPGGAGVEGMVPDEDLAPMFEQIAAMGGGEVPAAGPGTEPMPGEEVPGDVMGEGTAEGEESGGGAVDVTPIEQALGVPPDKAMRIYTTAQTFPKMEGKSPEEIGAALSTDFRTLMQIEEEMAIEDDKEAYAMDEDSEEMSGGGMDDMGGEGE
jgi:hypothetical protein